MTRLIVCWCLMGGSLLQAAGTAEHVVIVVWDGLRPDMVTPENTPTLSALARDGVFFSHHHPVYLSSTEVNGTALATGMYPAHSGIIGNREFRPRINPAEPVATEQTDVVRKGDAAMNGKYLAVPTIYEIAQAHGFPTTVAGSKWVALLMDRSEKRDSDAMKASVVVYQGQTLPANTRAELEKTLGPFPEKITYPNTGQNTWTTHALEQLWKPNIPKLSLLWLSDPDYPQHHTQPGSEESLVSLKVNDDLLAQLLDTLKAANARDKTDILVVSDHGFSTIEKNVDLEALLRQAGFHVFRKFAAKPQTGDILILGNGGSVFFYVTDHDKNTISKLVNFLQQGEYSGVIFSRSPLPGAFDLSVARINSADAPDVVLSLHWSDKANASGVKGGLTSEGNPLTARKSGQGMHGSLGHYDMHNTLIASGPDFRQGFIDSLPSGNTDIAPTVLWILNIPPAQKMDGRILSEALAIHPDPMPKAEQKIFTATSILKGNTWTQYLKTSRIGKTLYLDEGNGKQTPAK